MKRDPPKENGTSLSSTNVLHYWSMVNGWKGLWKWTPNGGTPHQGYIYRIHVSYISQSLASGKIAEHAENTWEALEEIAITEVRGRHAPAPFASPPLSKTCINMPNTYRVFYLPLCCVAINASS